MPLSLPALLTLHSPRLSVRLPGWDLQGAFLARYPGDKDPQRPRLRRDDSELTEDYRDAKRQVQQTRSHRRTDDPNDPHDPDNPDHYHDAEKSKC